jgi:hypothetical protein
MATTEWPRKTRSTLSWQHLAGHDADNGDRWSVIWDTQRRLDEGSRNTALEKFEASALSFARHMLKMGFIVYEIRNPSGSVFLEELGIKERLGLQPA